MMETDGGMAALLVSDAIEVGRLYIHQGRPRLFYENKKQKKTGIAMLPTARLLANL